jgi:hypothetical protein
MDGINVVLKIALANHHTPSKHAACMHAHHVHALALTPLACTHHAVRSSCNGLGGASVLLWQFAGPTAVKAA